VAAYRKKVRCYYRAGVAIGIAGEWEQAHPMYIGRKDGDDLGRGVEICLARVSRSRVAPIVGGSRVRSSGLLTVAIRAAGDRPRQN
jgi:hypothetical protein